MSDRLLLALAWAAGCGIGSVFFGGLWWTVQKGLSSRQPALWFLSSLLVRTGVALAGFYFVSGGKFERLLVCMLGFVTARAAVTWLTKPKVQSSSEARSAP